MDQLLLFLPFLLPVIVANFSEQHRRLPYTARDPRTNTILDLALRFSPHGLLIAINVGLMGLAGLSLLNAVAQVLMPEMVEPEAFDANWLAVAAACLLTSLLAFLPLISQVRRWLARWLPIDPDSLVHMTALAFAVYQLGLSLGQMALIGDLENLIGAEMALTIWDVLLSGIPFVLFALAGVGPEDGPAEHRGGDAFRLFVGNGHGIPF